MVSVGAVTARLVPAKSVAKSATVWSCRVVATLTVCAPSTQTNGGCVFGKTSSISSLDWIKTVKSDAPTVKTDGVLPLSRQYWSGLVRSAPLRKTIWRSDGVAMVEKEILWPVTLQTEKEVSVWGDSKLNSLSQSSSLLASSCMEVLEQHPS